jgi:hypothetical protein
MVFAASAEVSFFRKTPTGSNAKSQRSQRKSTPRSSAPTFASSALKASAFFQGQSNPLATFARCKTFWARERALVAPSVKTFST